MIFWVFLGSKFQKIFWKPVIFVKIFRKCRNFENSCHIWSNLMYNDVLKLKIGRGAEGAAKISRKRPFWANLGLCNATILRFWGLCNATIFENFGSPPPLNQPFWSFWSQIWDSVILPFYYFEKLGYFTKNFQAFWEQ